MLCWLTKGEADHWPIILKRHDDVYEEWKMSLTSFLAKAFRNEITCIIWDPFPADQLEFTPQGG